MSVLRTNDCGCKITDSKQAGRKSFPTTYYDLSIYEIEYCPLHAAAETLAKNIVSIGNYAPFQIKDDYPVLYEVIKEAVEGAEIKLSKEK